MKNERGQTTLEYVLLTFVVVVTLGGILFSFSKSAKRFLQNYYGEYFQCLLETGELPSLGLDDGGTGECNASFEPFTLAGGRPPVDNGVDDHNNSSSQDKNSKLNATADTNPSGSAAGAAGDGPDSSSGTSGRVPLSAREKRVIGKNGNSDKGKSSFGRSGGIIEEEDSSDRTTLVPVTGIYAKMLDEEDSHNQQVVAKAETDEAKAEDPKRIPANLDRKPKPTEDVDAGLTIPNFLRYLLIIAIILAIVIFFGGQILNFKKSQE